MTLTDTAGRSVTLAHEPQRLVLQDGRDMMMLALLDRDDPTARVKLWNNLERRADAGTWTSTVAVTVTSTVDEGHTAIYPLKTAI